MKANHKTIVENYLRANEIHALGYLAKSLSRNHEWELHFISFAIQRCRHLDNIKDKIAELATLSVTDLRSPTNYNSETYYHNLRAEFICLWFVGQVLGLNIVEIESKQHEVLSSNRTRHKSCDIRVSVSSDDLYFDVKDYSGEILSLGQPDQLGGREFEPADPERLKKWIEAQLGTFKKKGVNFGILIVPSMGIPDVPVLSETWLSYIFPEVENIGPKCFRVGTRKYVPKFLQGIYLLYELDHLLLHLSHISRCRDDSRRQSI